jgi:RNA polymerase-binding transcription factor
LLDEALFCKGIDMKESTARSGSERLRLLRNLLTRLRNEELGRIREFRRDQAQDAVTEPSDTLDVARSDEDLELHASLLARSEDRLNAINAAFEQLDLERYGTCARCKNEIAFERLEVMPFAVYCAECARKREPSREVGASSDEFLHRWTVPEGMVKSLGKEDVLAAPRETAHGVSTETSVARPAVTPKRRSARRKKPKRRRR